MLTQPTNSPTIEEMAKAVCKSVGVHYLDSYFKYYNKMVYIIYEKDTIIYKIKFHYDYLYNEWIEGRI